jgi:CBS domain-containing protein
MAEQGTKQHTLDRMSKTQEMVYELRVGEVMATKMVSVSPDQTMAEFRVILRENRLSGTPVVENGKLVGMISIEDLTHQCLDRKCDSCSDPGTDEDQGGVSLR